MVTFFLQAVTESCLQLMEKLSKYEFIKDFYLAGGTALALQIGHRISTDLDWFSSSNELLEQERQSLFLNLKKHLDIQLISEQNGMLILRLDDTDVSFIYQHHPLLETTIEYLGLRIASPVDIGLMKLAAINSRGTRRDFIDIYCLREFVSLEQLMELVSKKYPDRPMFLAVLLKALVYFDDAEQQPMPRMLRSVDWSDVRAYSQDSARRLTRQLSGL